MVERIPKQPDSSSSSPDAAQFLCKLSGCGRKRRKKAMIHAQKKLEKELES